MIRRLLMTTVFFCKEKEDKMRRLLVTLIALLCIPCFAHATLTTIGTAEYGGLTYNLIYDDNDTGYGGGGLTWLDYTNQINNWETQVNWALGLGASLTVNLNPGYAANIDWTTGWRLPNTVDGLHHLDYVGDPNGDGIYTYTTGYNLANSEMGHLFYTELGNEGYITTNPVMTTRPIPPGPEYFLQNTDDFDNLIANYYWLSTECIIDQNFSPDHAYNFWTQRGYIGTHLKTSSSYGMAVHSGEVLFNEVTPSQSQQLVYC